MNLTDNEIAGEARMVRLLNEIAWLIDHGRADETPRFFTADAVIDGALPARAGIDAISEAMVLRARARIASRHVHTNFRAVWGNSHSVVMHHTLSLYRTERPDGHVPPVAIFDIADRLRRGDDGHWRIAHRHIAPAFTNASSQHEGEEK